MIVWLTPKYDKGAPRPLELAKKPSGNTLVGTNGWTYFNMYHEGETWHRRYADAAKAAEKHRAKWLLELTAKAAEVASLPPIPGKAAA